MNRLAAAAPAVLVVAIVALFLHGCASAPAKPAPAAECQHDAQFFATDAQGRPSKAIYVCFRSDGVMVWEARTPTLEQLDALTKPHGLALAPPAPAVAPRKAAK